MSRKLLSLTLLLLLAATTAWGVAPTQEAIEKWKAEGVWEAKQRSYNEFKANGGCAPNEHSVLKNLRRNNDLAAQAGPDTIRVIVILVDFPDFDYTVGLAGDSAQFDSILFSDSATDAIYNPTGSMTDFYMENSYGDVYLEGDIFGWFEMPNDYSYYVGCDSCDGISGDGKARELALHAVQAADAAGANFHDYDRDNDLRCDGVIIIHAGQGAEEGAYGIWSHKWTVSGGIWYSDDEVGIDNYTMNPEETAQNGGSLSPIGVFCHEYGHFLGLPDLYDIDYNPGSNGCGVWSLMATGNYNGASKKPAHMDAWSKSQLGWISVIDVNQNMHQVPIPAAEYNPVAYKLQNGFTGADSYFLVENRQKTGFDLNLPNSGLCIIHVDNRLGSGSNSAPPYRIAIEQADGNYDLELSGNNAGDAGDTWPGSTNNRAFHQNSSPPSARNVDSTATRIGVWNISDSDSVMYADLDIEYSRPYIQLLNTTFDDGGGRGDGDGIPEAGETIHFYCQVQNLQKGSYNVRATLQSDNPALEFTVPTVAFDDDLFFSAKENATAIEFTVADTLTAVLDSFYLTITTDSLLTTPGSSEYSKQFSFEQQVGATQVLIVDDDRGANFQQDIADALYASRVPSRTWTKATEGSPQASDVVGYNIVLWHTGGRTTSAVFTQQDVDAMKALLDGGGNLMLSSISGIDDLWDLDSAFVRDYFRTQLDGTGLWIDGIGVDGTTIGNGFDYRIDASLNIEPTAYLTALSGGELVLQAGVNHAPTAGKYIGVAYNSGSYRTVITTLPVDVLNNGIFGYAPMDTLVARVVNYFGGIATSIYDGTPFTLLPQSFDLGQNYPNPFNPTTTIQYTLHGSATGEAPPRTRLVVYNALGQEVKTLVDEVQIPGTYSVEWNGTNTAGSKVASGLYFYRLERGEQANTRKMVLLK